MLEKWWSECVSETGLPLLNDGISEYYIYKGFRISRTGDILDILDVRKSDFYDPVTKGNMRTLKAYGFIKGADIIMYRRDLKKSGKCISILEDLYTERDDLKKKMEMDDKPSLKGNYNGVLKRIRYYMDLLFFYDSKIEQVKIKHKLK